jgi:hypothetical protein
MTARNRWPFMPFRVRMGHRLSTRKEQAVVAKPLTRQQPRPKG